MTCVGDAASSMFKGEYRAGLVGNFFYKYGVELLLACGVSVPPRDTSAAAPHMICKQRGLSSGKQVFSNWEEDTGADSPVGRAMNKIEAPQQASGEAQFTDDMPTAPGTTYAHYVLSSEPSAMITGIDSGAAESMPGFVSLVTAADIPSGGVNNCDAFLGAVFGHQPFFADKQVHFVGQPIGIVVADTPKHAAAAAARVVVQYGKVEGGKPAVLSARQAKKNAEAEDESKPSVIRTFTGAITNEFKRGADGEDLEKLFAAAKAGEGDLQYVEGEVYCKGQNHFPMETNAAYAVPVVEDQKMKVYSAMQWPGAVNKVVAWALNVPQNNVEIIARRAGGGFGGKITMPMAHAAAAAVAARKVGLPVKLQLERSQDMEITGGRHTADARYKAVVSKSTGKISAMSMDVDCDGGAYYDLSPFCSMALARACEQSYFFENCYIGATAYRTNSAPRTAMRGPGEIQGAFVVESAIEHIASAIGKNTAAVQEANFFDFALKDNQKDVAGKELTHYTIPEMWPKLKTDADYDARHADITAFNTANRWRKRGISMTTVKYEVGGLYMGALVNIYADGSVLLTHGGTEIGQGIHTKAQQTCAMALGKLCGKALDVKKIRIGDTNTHSMPNMGFTGGSTGSESVCEATLRACAQLVERMGPIYKDLEDGKKKAITSAWLPTDEQNGEERKEPEVEVAWEEVVAACTGFGTEMHLQASAAFQGRPTDQKAVNNDDKKMSSAHSYHNWGVVATEVEVDVLTGETNVLRTDMLYDCGKSLNPAIDIGQAEGAYVMGLGFLFKEDLHYAKNGRLLTSNTWDYKLPSARCIPQQLNMEFHKSKFEKGILSSKASGEPPLVLAVAAAMATRMAVTSARKDAGLDNSNFNLNSPLTVDNVMLACGGSGAAKF